jgi:hypothetical protein
MAIAKGHRFGVTFDEAFPQGLVLVGEVVPDNEYQSREDKARGVPVRQRVDEASGKRCWKASVTDPDEPNAKRKSFDLIFLADHQPVPTTAEVLPGMRPIELEGLTAEPKVAGNGEYKYQSFVYRATGFKAAGGASGSGKQSGSGNGAKASGGPADPSNKAA